MNFKQLAVLALAAALAASCSREHGNKSEPAMLLNVSYDPTREFYNEYNPLFQQYWLKKTGREIHVQQSNGGSGKQSLAVQNGLKADVVTLALAGDIDAISKNKKLIKPDWQKTLPHNSAPYTSTIVFLVRKGNPKQIKDWGDLVKNGIQIITPNPKTSGGARWNFLAAWAYAKSLPGASDASAEAFMKNLYRRVPVMDAGARAATVSFTQRGLGDVLLTWENEAHLAVKETGGTVEIVTPSLSILCEPSVAVVDTVTDAKGTRDAAKAYLQYLYSPEAQRLIAQHFYRPSDAKTAAEFKRRFPPLKLATIDADFGGWQNAQAKFFNDGGVFDRIYTKQ